MSAPHKPEPDGLRFILNNRMVSTTGAEQADYPLFGTCSECGEAILCADSTADWGHLVDVLAFMGIGTPRVPSLPVEASADMRALGAITRQVYEGFMGAGMTTDLAKTLTSTWLLGVVSR